MRVQLSRFDVSRAALKIALICAIASGSFVASVKAADLSTNSIKDPLPDTLTYAGITLYGVVDVNYTYQSKGMPFNSAYNTGVTYGIFGNPGAHGPISTLAESGLSQSFIGLRLEEPIAAGWSVVAKIEMGFNPLSGQLSDTCASSAQNNGTPLAEQTAHGDGPRCGQILNGPAYIGLSNDIYGTLTVGRQNTLDLDTIYNFDPFGLSYAFSAIGNLGSAGPGFGTAEGSRWDSAVKYRYQNGPIHAAAMYGGGGEDRGLHSGGYGFNVGGFWKDLAIDAVYTKQNGAIIATTLPIYVPDALAGTISDNSSYSVMGSYTFKFGNAANAKAPVEKLTLYWGYQNTELSSPKDPISNAVNSSTFGGYVLLAGYINSAPYITNKILQTGWIGAKYELPSGLSFVAGYYYVSQNSWIARSASGAVTAQCSTNASSNCSGDLNQASFMVDYAFNKHYDIYAGINYSKVANGFAAGYLADASINFVSGARVRF
jgi:predicted porin